MPFLPPEHRDLKCKKIPKRREFFSDLAQGRCGKISTIKRCQKTDRDKRQLQKEEILTIDYIDAQNQDQDFNPWLNSCHLIRNQKF